jgi:phytoene dehydrogenase-like protein
MVNLPAEKLDVAVVGAGPNGLTAAVLLARAGLSVRVFEANDMPGGGCRSAELTLPGFIHDICAAVHPMGVLSPAFRALQLERFGLEWVRSHHPLAHPLPDGRVAVLERSLEATGRTLGADAAAWRRTMEPFANQPFIDSLLKPLWYGGSGVNPLTTARFGLLALRSAESVARSRFKEGAARALFAGCAAHSVVALNRAGTASFGLVLAAAAHAIDWPVARGGSQSITAALVRALEQAGGVLQLEQRITSLRELPDARAILFDLSPRQVATIAGDALPPRFRRKYEAFRHGPAVFKVDWALREAIPWRSAECRAATTVHVCGDFADVLRSEADMMAGRIPEKPFVLVAQQSLVDPTRAPEGRHTGWAYCHVPARCPEDMTARIEAQIERFAPGFADCILARHTINPSQLHMHNLAMIGGDMAGGQNDLPNFLFRPVARWNPYTTPNPKLFLCSSSTPPGGGVHGMCGYLAAEAVLKRLGQ